MHMLDPVSLSGELPDFSLVDSTTVTVAFGAVHTVGQVPVLI